jgi:hypothetical protein
MQVFVLRSTLTLAADEAALVMATYDDSVPLTPDMWPAQCTLLSLPGKAIRNTALGTAPLGAQLEPGWRDTHKTQIPNGEAARRILAAFAEHSQRNSAHELSSLMAQHGVDSARWPAAAQRRKSEIDRAWSYVDAVRHAATGFGNRALPADPSADGHWPARIAVYQPS